MWSIIKILLMLVAFFYQFVIVYGAESMAEETGIYDQAIYELLWLILIFFIGESIINDDKT